MSWAIPDYTEIRDLGRGATGHVVLARHAQTGTHVAIKYLAEHLVGDEDFVRAFRAEARILSEVDDPQIAKLYEYVETTAGAAIVMELVNGVALRAILREHGPTDPPAALVVLKGSLLGLAAAHTRGVVHRDYKPENVLVGEDGQSKLADFGIAARTGRQTDPAGTPSYMAPEQWAGAAASPSTDIYAATATFFECLTGHPPYRAPGDLIGLRRQHEQAPIPLEQVPEPVRELVRRGLDKDPNRRPAEATSFLHELETVAGAGYGAGWEEDGRKSLARRAALLLLLFPLAGAIGGGTGVGQTILGLSTRARNLLIGAAATVLVIAGGVGGYYGLRPGSAPEPMSLPSPSTSVTAASPSASPSPSPSPSPIPSLSPTPSPSRTTTRPSPSKSTAPPKLQVTALQIADFCWIDSNSQCIEYRPADSRVRVHIRLKATTPQPISLNFHFTRIDGKSPVGTPQDVPRALEGQTSYDKWLVMAPDQTETLWCDEIKLTVSIVNVAGAPRQSDTIPNSCLG